MAIFGSKKKEVIPDLGQPLQRGSQAEQRQAPQQNGYSPASSYRTAAPSYVGPSQGGQGYGNYAPQANGYPAEKQRSAYSTDAKSAPVQGGMRGNGNDALRSQLLSGGRAAPPSYGNDSYQNGSDQYGRSGGQEQQVDDEDEEVEGIKQQMRFVKQESLASTRNAVRIAREAEETARATLDKLGDQSDRIANTERHLDMAKAHNDRAADEAKELKNLNKSIFRPSFTFNKASKRDKEEQRILNRHLEETAERESTRRDQYDSRLRIEGTYKTMDRMAENAAGANSRARARGAERGRYQFESTGSDDEVEDEIDHNLNDMSDTVGRLKALAMTAGQEVDAQNKKLERLDPKVAGLSDKIVLNTQRLGRIK